MQDSPETCSSSMNEYDEGSRLSLSLVLPSGEQPLCLDVEVVKAFKPFTMAVVCEVTLVGDNAENNLTLLSQLPNAPSRLSDTFILKLYDRRYNRNLREQGDRGRPYTEDREPAYQAYVAEHGDYPKAFEWPDPWDEPDSDDEDFDPNVYWLEPGRIEAIVGASTQRQFKLEIEVYSRMRAGRVRGERPAAPFFYGTITRESAIGTLNGLLMEKISPTIPLNRLFDVLAPCGHSTQKARLLFDVAGRSLSTIMGYGFINKDVRGDNMFLQYPPDLPEDLKTWSLDDIARTRVIFFDFGMGRFQHENETDKEFLFHRWDFGEPHRLCNILVWMMVIPARTACETHAGSCRSHNKEAEEELFRWKLKYDKAYEFRPTDDERKIICRWNRGDRPWGCHDKWYPKTMAEMEEALKDEEFNGVYEGMFPKWDLMLMGDDNDEQPATHTSQPEAVHDIQPDHTPRLARLTLEDRSPNEQTSAPVEETSASNETTCTADEDPDLKDEGSSAPVSTSN